MIVNSRPGVGDTQGNRKLAVRRLLRSCERDELRCMRLAALLQALGCDAWYERKAEMSRSIAASAALGDTRIDVSIVVDDWCHHAIDNGQRIAFQAIDDAYLLALFRRSVRTQRVAIGSHELAVWRAEAIVDSRRAAWSVVVRTDANWLFTIRAWPDALLGRIVASRSVPAWCEALDVHLTLSIGRSDLVHQHIASLRKGDLILVRSADWLAKIGAAPIASFSLHGEVLKLSPFDNTSLEQRGVRAGVADPSSTADDAARDDVATAARLDDLPVEVEFILDRVTLTWSELRSMGPGAEVPIQRGCLSEPDGTHAYRVSLRAGGQSLGEGELVTLNDTLAVLVTRIDLAR